MKRRTVTFAIIGVLFVFGLGCLSVFLLFQFLSFNQARTNPPVIQEPNWSDQQTREVAKRACYDCHSNETVWPWYSSLPPVSWLVQRDVVEGREKINFSEWGRGEQMEETDDLVEVVQEGEMPLKIYLLMHPEAKLTSEERQVLLDGFRKTFQITGEEHED